MKILIDKTFDKDTRKITSKKLLNAIADCIENVREANKIGNIKNCKKLKGSKDAYRIRIGVYRIGLVYEKKTMEFVRLLHSNKIYDAFP